ncbi:MAG TPA: hypothetical protein VKZ98_01110 [Aquaticitalea sp.]|nr:hypothetical protein [Aquaticitalea sp.]
MKQVYAGFPKSVVLGLLLAILLANGIATYLDYAIIPNITRFISVLVILTLYYTKQNQMASVFLCIFLFLFLGDTFYVFNFGQLSDKLSTTFYLGSYCLLTFVLLGKLKRIKYEGLVSVYLILVLLLNSYFLYMLYGLLKDSFTDTINLVLYICRGITLIGMAFFAFAIYLSKETTQSINFLVMVCCFVFSDVLSYICDLYVYYWVFDFIGNMLHVASLGIFYVYVSNHHKIVKVRGRDVERESAYIIKGTGRLSV